MKENYLPGLLIIGGSSRNVGKTTLATTLIRRYRETHEIIGLKVTSIYPKEKNYHGNHEKELTGDYEIFEETNPDGYKDTSKMLWHGAKKVYYVRAQDHAIQAALNEFYSLIPENPIIVCESISLRQFVKPGLFVLIQSTLSHQAKVSFQKMLPYADLVIHSDGKEFDFNVDRLVFENGAWEVR